MLKMPIGLEVAKLCSQACCRRNFCPPLIVLTLVLCTQRWQAEVGAVCSLLAAPASGSQGPSPWDGAGAGQQSDSSAPRADHHAGHAE